eukprot:GHVL01042254.1.p1 GENE.GHVL01042254.1~~GHVL01042254.1.p1  ORF type:complete len:1282 (+),score=217.25 GHVL01042254.1:1033-4878(+)
MSESSIHKTIDDSSNATTTDNSPSIAATRTQSLVSKESILRPKKRPTGSGKRTATPNIRMTKVYTGGMTNERTTEISGSLTRTISSPEASKAIGTVTPDIATGDTAWTMSPECCLSTHERMGAVTPYIPRAVTSDNAARTELHKGRLTVCDNNRTVTPDIKKLLASGSTARPRFHEDRLTAGRSMRTVTPDIKRSVPSVGVRRTTSPEERWPTAITAGTPDIIRSVASGGPARTKSLEDRLSASGSIRTFTPDITKAKAVASGDTARAMPPERRLSPTRAMRTVTPNITNSEVSRSRVRSNLPAIRTDTRDITKNVALGGTAIIKSLESRLSADRDMRSVTPNRPGLAVSGSPTRTKLHESRLSAGREMRTVTPNRTGLAVSGSPTRTKSHEGRLSAGREMRTVTPNKFRSVVNGRTTKSPEISRSTSIQIKRRMSSESKNLASVSLKTAGSETSTTGNPPEIDRSIARSTSLFHKAGNMEISNNHYPRGFKSTYLPNKKSGVSRSKSPITQNVRDIASTSETNRISYTICPMKTAIKNKPTRLLTAKYTALHEPGTVLSNTSALDQTRMLTADDKISASDQTEILTGDEKINALGQAINTLGEATVLVGDDKIAVAQSTMLTGVDNITAAAQVKMLTNDNKKIALAQVKMPTEGDNTTAENAKLIGGDSITVLAEREMLTLDDGNITGVAAMLTVDDKISALGQTAILTGEVKISSLGQAAILTGEVKISSLGQAAMLTGEDKISSLGQTAIPTGENRIAVSETTMLTGEDKISAVAEATMLTEENRITPSTETAITALAQVGDDKGTVPSFFKTHSTKTISQPSKTTMQHAAFKYDEKLGDELTVSHSISNVHASVLTNELTITNSQSTDSNRIQDLAYQCEDENNVSNDIDSNLGKKCSLSPIYFQKKNSLSCIKDPSVDEIESVKNISFFSDKNTNKDGEIESNISDIVEPSQDPSSNSSCGLTSLENNIFAGSLHLSSDGQLANFAEPVYLGTAMRTWVLRHMRPQWCREEALPPPAGGEFVATPQGVAMSIGMRGDDEIIDLLLVVPESCKTSGVAGSLMTMTRDDVLQCDSVPPPSPSTLTKLLDATPTEVCYLMDLLALTNTHNCRTMMHLLKSKYITTTDVINEEEQSDHFTINDNESDSATRSLTAESILRGMNLSRPQDPNGPLMQMLRSRYVKKQSEDVSSLDKASFAEDILDINLLEESSKNELSDAQENSDSFEQVKIACNGSCSDIIRDSVCNCSESNASIFNSNSLQFPMWRWLPTIDENCENIY